MDPTSTPNLPRPDVTILVLTFGRPDLLRRTLESVLKACGSSLPPEKTELVVVINGPDLHAEAEVDRLAATGTITTRKVLLTTPLRPGAARNAGFAVARGEWIFFLDDDAYVDPDYFARWSAALPKYPDAVVFGGPNLTPPGSTRFQRAVGAALASRFATYLSHRRYRPVGSPGPAGETDLILCNLWVRRGALEKIAGGPFSTVLDCNEENLLLQQLAAVDARMVYQPGLSVWHERRECLGSLARQVFKYGRGRAQNTRVRPASLHPVHVLPTLCLLAFPVILYLALTRSPLWLLPAGLYALCVALAGIAAGSSTGERALTAVIFGVIHAGYGAGFLRGLFGPAGRESRR